MKRASDGFTIVELMIAMLIFMIVCAIAIPSYMSATQRAHEAVAASFLRQVQTGQEAYRLNGQQYADTFAKLQPYISADLVEPKFPQPWLGDGLITTAYAEPIPASPPQGNSGSAPGQGGSNPGNGGTPPGQGGSNPGNGGTPPGQGGTGSGSGSTGSGTTPSDSKVYSMYIFQLTLTDPQHWSCTGEPVRDRLKSKFFYTDQTDVLRYSVGSLADSLSSQL